jgi:hypothetical protein
MNFKKLHIALSLVIIACGCASEKAAAEKIEKEKLQVFIMLGQSNMVGHATVGTFQYLLDDMYKPSFEDVESQLKMSVFYGKVFSKYGLDLTEKMRRDSKNFTKSGGALKGHIRGQIVKTISDGEFATEKDLYKDMNQRMDTRIPLRQDIVKRYMADAKLSDFEGFKNLLNQARNTPAAKKDSRNIRLEYAKLVQQKTGLPIAKRTHIAAYGSLDAVDSFKAPASASKAPRKYANGPLSIGWGGLYSKIGPEYAFGIAMEEKLDAPILIIKVAWGGTQLCSSWRSPSNPDRLESATNKAHRLVQNEILRKKAQAEGKEFKPHQPQIKKSPGDLWHDLKFHEYIKNVLADLGKYHPEYDPAIGHDIAGLVWFQGHSDADHTDGLEYKSNMAHFIRDIRKEVKAPEMPVVIGTVSTAVHTPRYNSSSLVQSQLAVAKMPEFKGTVTTVPTITYYPTELELLFTKLKGIEKQVNNAKKQGKPEPAILKTDDYKKWRHYRDTAISNKGYHYMGSAEFFVETGDAYASAMVDQMKKQRSSN